ncbi:hypothetical protein F5J09_04345 [Lacticaseibacillus paracasei]|nr:hypothetical protein F5J09_04345 [Lacticaseibacillus paracasei]
MLCKHHFSKNGQVFFHIFWVVTLIMQSRRIILFKLGIYNIPINIIVGFGVSLAISLIAVYLSERVRLIKLVFYPLRKQKIEVITHD